MILVVIFVVVAALTVAAAAAAALVVVRRLTTNTPATTTTTTPTKDGLVMDGQAEYVMESADGAVLALEPDLMCTFPPANNLNTKDSECALESRGVSSSSSGDGGTAVLPCGRAVLSARDALQLQCGITKFMYCAANDTVRISQRQAPDAVGLTSMQFELQPFLTLDSSAVAALPAAAASVPLRFEQLPTPYMQWSMVRDSDASNRFVLSQLFRGQRLYVARGVQNTRLLEATSEAGRALKFRVTPLECGA